MSPREKQRKWYSQILSGNPGAENPRGDVAMALSPNYDKVFHERAQRIARPVRQEQLLEA